MRGVTRSPAGTPPAVRIELENQWVWCGDRRLELTPKVFAVLRHLVEHPARLVTKDELLAAVWGGVAVGEATLSSAIRDLRRALDDSSRAPRYVQTVHRRGFRFIGPIAPQPAAGNSPGPPTFVRPSAALVGRDDELARLHALFAAARGGKRQVVFVTGEPGIGKTTLVEVFLAGLGAEGGLRIGRGQCVEQYGAGEAYLPVLEALGRMGREAGGDALVRILRQFAPTWLAQLPALLSDDDLAAVQRRAPGATRERMLRELIEALDALAVDAPVVLLLEDLHWSDSATIDLLTMLARRRDPARLLVLGTYRPAEVATGHPLRPAKQELQVHGHCEELALDFLDQAAVGDYLATRFPGAAFDARFVRVLHESTGGNPLFLVNVVDDLVAQGHLRDVDGRWEPAVSVEDAASRVPDTLSQMVEQQVDRLTPAEQAMLAVGSVAGAEFSSALATADGIDPQDGEQRCAALARRGQMLRTADLAEWPDGTLAGRYRFIHALYRNVIYARVPVGHRVGLHLRIGDRLERAWGARRTTSLVSWRCISSAAGTSNAPSAITGTPPRPRCAGTATGRPSCMRGERSSCWRRCRSRRSGADRSCRSRPCSAPPSSRRAAGRRPRWRSPTGAPASSVRSSASRRSSSRWCSVSPPSISCAASCRLPARCRSGCWSSPRRRTTPPSG